MRHFLRTMCGALAIAGALLAPAWALDIPALQGRVNDYSHVLTDAQRTELAGQLKAIEDRTTAQVVILTIPTLKGEDIKSFGLKVGRAWGIGQKNKLDGNQKKDNGVVVLNVTGDRKIRIEVGKGLEGAIPDLAADQVIDAMKPALKKGDFAAAYKAAIDAIAKRIDAEYGTGKKAEAGAPAATSGGSDDPFSGDGWWMFLIPLVLAAFLGGVHPLVGGMIGAGGEALVSSYWFATPGVIAGAIIGLILGLIANFILRSFGGDILSDVVLSGGGGGGSFSGGGGSFGGGGSDDDY